MKIIQRMVLNSFPATNDITNSILNGILLAKQNYTNWTADELYLSYAPKNFLTIHIAQEIAKLDNPPEIFLDATIADILRCSLSTRDQFRQFMYEKQIPQRTLSITLDARQKHYSDNDAISKAIISVHNGVRNAKKEYCEEIDLLCKMLDHNSKSKTTLEFGAFAFYLDISYSARIKAQTRMQQIIKQFDEIVHQYKNVKSYFKGGNIETIDNIGEWSLGCYIIEPLNKQQKENK